MVHLTFGSLLNIIDTSLNRIIIALAHTLSLTILPLSISCAPHKIIHPSSPNTSTRIPHCIFECGPREGCAAFVLTEFSLQISISS